MLRINLDEAAERWRYRCPAGHTQWTAINGGFYCGACANCWKPDTEPSFEELHDAKTEETYHRDEIQFVAEERRHFQAEYAVEHVDDVTEKNPGETA